MIGLKYKPHDVTIPGGYKKRDVLYLSTLLPSVYLSSQRSIALEIRLSKREVQYCAVSLFQSKISQSRIREPIPMFVPALLFVDHRSLRETT